MPDSHAIRGLANKRRGHGADMKNLVTFAATAALIFAVGTALARAAIGI